jgi:heme exporter protein D
MQWNNIGEFLAMGGYGLYVWGSFGVTLAALLMEPLLLRKRQHDAIRNIRRELRAANRPLSPTSRATEK